MGFEFQALQDQLAAMQREIRELKRSAPSGVVMSSTVNILPAGGALAWDGPNGAIYANILRVNQWADIQFNALLAAVGSPSGAFVLQAPWPVVGAHPTVHTPVGAFDCNTAAGYLTGTIYLYGTSPTNMELYTGTTSLTLVTATTPATWAVGNNIRGNLRVRIAPGY